MARLSRPLAGLVFDLDETLVDSRAHILHYQRDLFAWLGRAFPADEEDAFFTLDREALERRFFPPRSWRGSVSSVAATPTMPACTRSSRSPAPTGCSSGWSPPAALWAF